MDEKAMHDLVDLVGKQLADEIKDMGVELGKQIGKVPFVVGEKNQEIISLSRWPRSSKPFPPMQSRPSNFWECRYCGSGNDGLRCLGCGASMRGRANGVGGSK